MEKKELLRKEILDFFKYSIGGNDTRSILSIGKLTPSGREVLEKLRGESFRNKDVEFILCPSDMRHIYNDHYEENEKDKGNNIPLNDADIGSIVDMLENVTHIVFGVNPENKQRLFFFLSQGSNGCYNLSEIYSNDNGNLNLKSLYKTKKGPSQRVMMLMNTLLSTSVTYSGSTLSLGAKIQNLFELTNKFEEKIPLERNWRLRGLAEEYGLSHDILQDYVTSYNDKQESSFHFQELINKYLEEHPRLNHESASELIYSIKPEIDELIGQNLTFRRNYALLNKVEQFSKNSGVQLEIKDGHPFIPGDLDLRKSSVKRLPDDLEVRGTLNISGTDITILPNNLHVGKNLVAENTPIKNIQRNVTIGGELKLRNNPEEVVYIASGLKCAKMDLLNSEICELKGGFQTNAVDVTHARLMNLPDITSLKGDNEVIINDSEHIWKSSKEYNRNEHSMEFQKANRDSAASERMLADKLNQAGIEVGTRFRVEHLNSLNDFQVKEIDLKREKIIFGPITTHPDYQGDYEWPIDRVLENIHINSGSRWVEIDENRNDVVIPGAESAIMQRAKDPSRHAAFTDDQVKALDKYAALFGGRVSKEEIFTSLIDSMRKAFRADLIPDAWVWDMRDEAVGLAHGERRVTELGLRR